MVENLSHHYHNEGNAILELSEMRNLLTIHHIKDIRKFYTPNIMFLIEKTTGVALYIVSARS